MTAAIEVTGIVVRWPPNPWATRSVPSAHSLTGCRPIRSLTGGTGRASGGPAGSDTTFLLAAADTDDGEGVNAPPDSRVSRSWLRCRSSAIVRDSRPDMRPRRPDRVSPTGHDLNRGHAQSTRNRHLPGVHLRTPARCSSAKDRIIKIKFRIFNFPLMTGPGPCGAPSRDCRAPNAGVRGRTSGPAEIQMPPAP